MYLEYHSVRTHGREIWPCDRYACHRQLLQWLLQLELGRLYLASTTVESCFMTATKRFWMSRAEESPLSKHRTMELGVDIGYGRLPYGS